MHGGIVLVGLLHNSWVFCADGKRYVLVRFGFPIRKYFYMNNRSYSAQS